MSSVTTTDERRLYLDPRMRPLLAGRHVALVDDVISTGKSITAGLALLRICGIEPVAIGAAMLQTQRWRDTLGADAQLVQGVFTSPLLERDGQGWRPAA
jgi:adenine/guanine phosphoribosyltransferase-like PRPP-binding protein